MNDFMGHPNLTFLITESNLPFIFKFCIIIPLHFNPLSANPTKWSNTQIIRRQQPNCNELFDCVRTFCGVGAWRVNSFHYLKYWEEIFLLKFFFLFVFEAFLKDFPFYSPILLDLWFKYLKIRRKESFMCHSGQRFFKTPNETPTP